VLPVGANLLDLTKAHLEMIQQNMPKFRSPAWPIGDFLRLLNLAKRYTLKPHFAHRL
jgi:hypothetical protein